MAKSSVWKFQFNDEQTAYLKRLLNFATNEHADHAKRGSNSEFTQLAHSFSGSIANELLDEINSITG
jgi:23S rRNA maturation mini-RNase III